MFEVVVRYTDEDELKTENYNSFHLLKFNIRAFTPFTLNSESERSLYF